MSFTLTPSFSPMALARSMSKPSNSPVFSFLDSKGGYWAQNPTTISPLDCTFFHESSPMATRGKTTNASKATAKSVALLKTIPASFVSRWAIARVFLIHGKKGDVKVPLSRRRPSNTSTKTPLCPQPSSIDSGAPGTLFSLLSFTAREAHAGSMDAAVGTAVHSHNPHHLHIRRG